MVSVMNLQPKRLDDVELNITPLIDVVFLLLIFFMVSTTFDQPSKIKIDLPEASAEPSAAQKDAIVLAVDASGQYFIGDQKVVNTSFETLSAALRKSLDGDLTKPVVLRADAKTPHASVVLALDALSTLGVSNLSIATIER